MENVDFDKIRRIAENYYKNGDFFCSETVVKIIKDEFKLEVSDEAIAMASGFSCRNGGAGCTELLQAELWLLGWCLGEKKQKIQGYKKQ